MLARALAQGGEVLVLDEPTNHLDIAHQLDLMRVVSGLGTTVIAALHDLNIAAAFCDDVAVLDGGASSPSGRRRPCSRPRSSIACSTSQPGSPWRSTPRPRHDLPPRIRTDPPFRTQGEEE